MLNEKLNKEIMVTIKSTTKDKNTAYLLLFKAQLLNFYESIKQVVRNTKESLNYSKKDLRLK